MKTLITRIKRLALALCLATPIVSWAAPTATAVWQLHRVFQKYNTDKAIR